MFYSNREFSKFRQSSFNYRLNPRCLFMKWNKEKKNLNKVNFCVKKQ